MGVGLGVLKYGLDYFFFKKNSGRGAAVEGAGNADVRAGEGWGRDGQGGGREEGRARRENRAAEGLKDMLVGVFHSHL